MRFAGFFFVQNLSRGLLLSVIPLQAFSLLHEDAQSVSVLFFAVSLGGILAALVTPIMITQIGNHSTFIIATGAMGVSLVALASFDVSVFTLGLFLHVFAIATAEVTLHLYVLTLIPRRNLLSFEPWRIFCMVGALTMGPFLGVYLSEQVHHLIPFVISEIAVLGTLFYFYFLKLHKTPVRPSTTQDVNPLRHIARYFSQPRLRLAYALTVARSAWWMMFVVYVPIYAEQTELGKLAGAAIVSMGNAWTLTVPFWGWVGRRYGVRHMLIGGFTATSIFSLLVFIYADMPSTAAWLLVIAALGASILDGAGNILFLRSVRTHNKSEMAAVFITYRDTSQLAAPGLFALLLKFYALPVVFISAAAWMTVSAWLCRYIPKSMR